MTNKDPTQSQLPANVSQSNTPADASSSSNTIASQVVFLQNFLASPQPSEEEATSNVSTLLRQLDTADGVAQGVESKLDKLLENLEGMLEGLEGSGGPQEGGKTTNEPASSEPRKPDTHEKDAG